MISPSGRQAHGLRWKLRGTAALAILTIFALTGGRSPATAQFSNGAVIVTVPSTADNSAPATKPQSKPSKTSRRPKKSVRRRARAPQGADRLKIAVLVNDDPITQYEINQRAALLASGSGVSKRAQANFQSLIKQKGTNQRLRQILQETVEANQGQSREQILAIFERRKKQFAQSLQRQAVASARRSIIPGMRKQATSELIDERLKMQAATKAKMLIPVSQAEDVMRGIAKRNKLSFDGFKAQLKRQGTDFNAMRSRIRAQLSWMRLVNAKFGRFVDVNQKTIDETVVGGADAAQVSLHLHRIVFKLPKKLTQRAVAQRMIDADQLRAGFTGCATSQQLARSSSDVVFQDLGFKVASAIDEPTRSLLLNAKDGEMAPPVTMRDGVALYAVCSRRAGTKSFAARAAAERKLRQQHTEIYGRKYLSDLKREAHIEYRDR